MSVNRDITVESALPVVSSNGLNTNQAVDFTGSPSVALPAGTTIGGSAVVALGNISSNSATATAFSVTNTGVFTGTSVQALIADSLTTGTANLTSTNGQTTGHNNVITSTGTIVTTGDLLSVIGNNATTSTGLVRISGTGMTTGSTMLITGGGANQTSAGKVIEVAMGASTVGIGESITTTGVYTGAGILQLVANSATSGTLASISGTGLTSGVGFLITGGTSQTSTGALFKASLGAATAGSGIDIVTTGVYTDTTGLLNITAASATTGTLAVVSGAGLTTGTGLSIIGTAATLSTGFYLAANDGALNVFTVGANGHLTSNQTTAPTIAVTTQNGITAAAITAGSTDTCGTITTTGTNNNGGNTVLTVTFNKTYTVAPKFVVISEVNNSAGIASIFTTTTATTFVLNIIASASSGATPSWAYMVVA